MLWCRFIRLADQQHRRDGERHAQHNTCNLLLIALSVHRYDITDINAQAARINLGMGVDEIDIHHFLLLIRTASSVPQ